MQCQRCERPATVHLTEIINGKKIEQHLCDQCAQKEGVTITASIPLSEFLLNQIEEQQAEAKQKRDMECPYCHTTWGTFRRTGLLGCPHDYEVFRDALTPLLERAHDGALTHQGRSPRNRSQASEQIQLIRLREELKHAVEGEDYETAARLRDELKRLQE
ncbi:MAG: UvrB/UvrC motif-containing protein [Sedimentisphaerales bacterium]|nr:UvrB/UvrC motif-containing protein [Sedimentisphaerales bacterium]